MSIAALRFGSVIALSLAAALGLLAPREAFAQPTPAPLLADLSGDGVVSIRDAVLDVIGQAGMTDYDATLDCDRDGEIDGADLDCIVAGILLVSPTFDLPINPADASLLLAVSSGGKLVEVQGTKDATGAAEAASLVFVTGAGGKLTTVTVDAAGLPATMVAPDGTTSKFTWTSPTQTFVNVTTADGFTQAIVSVDLANPMPLVLPAQRPAGEPPPTPSRLARGGEAVQLQVLPWIRTPDSPVLASLQANADLLVSRCGAPVDGAATSLTVTPPGGGVPYLIAGVGTGGGQYVFSVPAAPATLGVTVTEACEAVSSVLSSLCDGLQVMGPQAEFIVCPALATAVSAIATPAAGVAVLKACFGGFGALRIACETIGFSPSAGAPSLLDQACPLVGSAIGAVDRFVVGEVSMVAKARIPGQGVASVGPILANATGPFPGFVIDSGDAVEIVAFTISPTDPGPVESYVATAFIACAPEDTEVVIDIVGTDGYTDFVQAFVTGDALVQLFVPGGAEGVSDTVTVTIVGGPSRTASLVF